MEIWKDVVNYKGIYQVSNLGNILSYARKIPTLLKLRDNNRGYLSTYLSKDGIKKMRTVHQLVAEAFLNHIPCGYEIVVDHIDNNPLNNRLDNLQLLTNRQNSSKEVRGTSRFVGVHKTKNNKWRAMIRYNGKKHHIGMFNCETSAHLAYQLKLNSVI